MDEQNLNKLADLLNICISSTSMGHDINNPTYTSLYFEIFFDEISKNQTPPHGDSFIDKLILKIDMNKPKSQKKIEDFQTVWNSWTMLYREIVKRGFLKK
ncbi:hypothetical protein [Legionella micdadei]|uniref:Uncharacterized protein n=1 Tax=Legionella micdadei TaxID=451 RepID=A0A098GHL1_LEGMI|nr:hypothetical protein [Legionella micdadei]ARG97099.1 hypothetical protein B6N58_05170 [Legionella micdadei]KTD29306.1 hypothetical protein Lmic_1226 [Legionella micdadei]NSL19621.1 hypothetical protein [Legionella micdadei]CEG61462.1 protein of unknown function [Legionella micdadei]SCY41692.1 hypothetical protein SAMN02982997_01671 [Legionella micdadei]